MVYARYIKRGNKRLGPYYYKNVRDKEGKVRTIYLGRTNPEEKDYVNKLKESIVLQKDNLISIAIVTLFLLGFLFIQGSITGFVVDISDVLPDNLASVNQTFETNTPQLDLETINITEPQITNETESIIEQTIQGEAEIGKPVRWTKIIKLKKKTANLTVTLPQNISDLKIKQEVKQKKFSKNNLVIEDEIEELEIEYYTEAPKTKETKISEYKKQVIVYSEIHYENVLTYTTIQESKKENIKLYQIKNNSRILVNNITYLDENSNGLIEKITWITPLLSEQTYELEITIINVQSYPTLGGNWTVMFETIGTANLTITAVNNTSFGEDLKFLELRCGNIVFEPIFDGTKVSYENYNCAKTGYETSQVLTTGKHILKFEFGGSTAYAYNLVGGRATFYENSTWGQNLTKVGYGSVALGDYDNDGDLDLILTGFNRLNGINYAKIYENNGTSLRENKTYQQNLTKVNTSTVAWGDIDNDNDLDLILTGYYGSDYAGKVYENNGTSLRENKTWQQNFPGVDQASVAFGDYDNDGDLDFVLTAELAGSGFIFENNGTAFVRNSTWQYNLTEAQQGALAWGDYDNDGDLDLVLTGGDYDGGPSGTSYAKIYENNGTSLRENKTWQQNLTAVNTSSVAWGDYDNDGDLDLVLVGKDDTGTAKAKIYENNGTSLRENKTYQQNLTGVFYSDVAWGDYDNDGDLDLVLCGADGAGAEKAKIYENNGTSFSENKTYYGNLTSVYQCSLAWGDIDNDNDLDLIIIGEDADPKSTAKVYINNISVSNTRPNAPSSLNVSFSYAQGIMLNITWGNGSDAETHSTGLYYNLRVGTSSDANNTVSGTYGGFSDPPAGYFGNMMQRKSISLKVPNKDYYYIAVQTIDPGLRKSSWSTEVRYANSAPDFSGPIPNASWNSDTSSSITLSNYFSDSNYDNLTYKVYGNESIEVTINQTTSVATLSQPSTWSGTEELNFTGTDANVGSNTTYSNYVTYTVLAVTTGEAGGGGGTSIAPAPEEKVEEPKEEPVKKPEVKVVTTAEIVKELANELKLSQSFTLLDKSVSKAITDTFSKIVDYSSKYKDVKVAESGVKVTEKGGEIVVGITAAALEKAYKVYTPLEEELQKPKVEVKLIVPKPKLTVYIPEKAYKVYTPLSEEPEAQQNPRIKLTVDKAVYVIDYENDLDGDKLPNEVDPDIDNDGIKNEQDSDSDNDGFPNPIDIDFDNDGIPNFVEEHTTLLSLIVPQRKVPAAPAVPSEQTIAGTKSKGSSSILASLLLIGLIIGILLLSLISYRGKNLIRPVFRKKIKYLEKDRQKVEPVISSGLRNLITEFNFLFKKTNECVRKNKINKANEAYSALLLVYDNLKDKLDAEKQHSLYFAVKDLYESLLILNLKERATIEIKPYEVRKFEQPKPRMMRFKEKEFASYKRKLTAEEKRLSKIRNLIEEEKIEEAISRLEKKDLGFRFDQEKRIGSPLFF